jgi:hypothetical protein
VAFEDPGPVLLAAVAVQGHQFRGAFFFERRAWRVSFAAKRPKTAGFGLSVRAAAPELACTLSSHRFWFGGSGCARGRAAGRQKRQGLTTAAAHIALLLLPGAGAVLSPFLPFLLPTSTDVLQCCTRCGVCSSCARRSLGAAPASGGTKHCTKSIHSKVHQLLISCRSA